MMLDVGLPLLLCPRRAEDQARSDDAKIGLPVVLFPRRGLNQKLS